MPLLDEFVRLCRHQNDLDGVRLGLTLKLKLFMDGPDDRGLLNVLQELAEAHRQVGAYSDVITALGTQMEVLERMGRVDEAVKVTIEMERHARLARDPNNLAATLKHRLKLYLGIKDRDRALETTELVIQAGIEANDLDLVQATLAQRAFLYTDFRRMDLASRAFDDQERVCRQLGDPQALATCLINNALAKTADKATSLRKAREAELLIARHNLNELKPKIGPIMAYLTSL